MPYCNSADMISRYGNDELVQRTDRNGAGVIDVAVLDAAIGDASAEIDSYLSGFVLPVQSTVLVLICCDLARYRLYDDQRMYEDGKPVNQVAVRYERWITYLKEVASGKLKLAPDTAGAVVSTVNLPVMQSASRVFARES